MSLIAAVVRTTDRGIWQINERLLKCDARPLRVLRTCSLHAKSSADSPRADELCGGFTEDDNIKVTHSMESLDFVAIILMFFRAPFIGSIDAACKELPACC
jgi:hypothetical protein